MMQPSTRQRRQQKIKQAILRAAHELINENGAQSLSLRAVARRIDYSPAGLYEYFDSKHQLLEAVREEALERLQRYLENVPPHLGPGERLFEMGLAYLSFARREPEEFLLIFATPVARHAWDEPISVPYQILQEAVQAAVDAGEFQLSSGLKVEQIVYGLWSLIHGLAMLQQTHLRHVEDDFETINRWTLEIFSKGLKAI